MSAEQTPTEAGKTLFSANLLRVLLRRSWVIVLVAAVLAGSAVGFSLMQTPTYEASAKILIGQRDADESGGGNLKSNVEGLQEFAPTMAKALTTRPVKQEVVEQLGMPEEDAGALLDTLRAQQDPGTTFVDVSYRDSDPKRAQLVVNTVGQVFSEQVSDLSPNVGGVTATVWEQATLPQSPVSPDPARNGVVALALGILLGAGLALLLELLDDSWDSPEEAERISGVSTLGAIPQFEVPVREKANVSESQKVELEH